LAIDPLQGGETAVTATAALMSHTPTSTIASRDEIHVCPLAYQIVPLSSSGNKSAEVTVWR
jgi:hypothetical protein